MSRYKAYPEYRDSGVAWLGMVPSHWKMCRIKDISTINPAKSEARALPPETEVSFIPMEAIGENGELDASRTKAIFEVISGYSYVEDGDIMIAKIAPCFENGKGAVAKNLANGIGFATTEVINIRPHNQEGSAYLFYLLSADPFRKLAEGSMYGAGGQKRVADSFVAEYHLSLPCDFEREKIAAFLDHETAKIDALIEKQRRLIELLKEKRQAVINHVVTKGLNPNAPMKDSGVEWLGEVPVHWAVTKFKNLVVDSAAGPYGASLTKSMYTTSGIRVYGQQQVIPDDFSIGDYCISEEKFEAMRRYEVSPGDILISVMGTVGKVAVVPEGVERGIINPRLVKYKVSKEKILPAFAKAFVLSEASQSFLLFSAQGSTMDGLNMQILGELTIAYPDTKEQREILEDVSRQSEKFLRLLDRAQGAVELLTERRSALISAAVTGKIDVRDWQPAAEDDEAGIKCYANLS